MINYMCQSISEELFKEEYCDILYATYYETGLYKSLQRVAIFHSTHTRKDKLIGRQACRCEHSHEIEPDDSQHVCGHQFDLDGMKR